MARRSTLSRTRHDTSLPHLSWKTGAALGLAALVLRSAYFLAVSDEGFVRYPILDASYYVRWAESILAGTPFTTFAYFVEPGYAYLLAAFLAAGPDGLQAVLWFQILLGSLVPILVFATTARLTASRPAALVAGILAVAAGPSVFYDASLFKTSVEIFLLSVIALSTTVVFERPTRPRLVLLGVLIGVTALIKANILYAAAPLVIWMIFRSKPFGRHLIETALLVAGIAVAIAPVTIRNFLAEGSLVPINASGGPNLYIGIWEGADGSLRPPEYISVDPTTEEASWRAVAEADVKRPLGAGEVSAYWTGRAISEALSHPIRTIGLVADKAGLIVTSRVVEDNLPPDIAADRFPFLRFLVPAWAIIGAGLIGTILALGDRASRARWTPTAMLAAGYAATLLAAHVAERYRIALVPLLLPGAGFLAVETLRRVRSRSFLGMFWLGLLILLLVGTAFASGRGASSSTAADARHAIAIEAARRDDRSTAREEVAAALRTDPFHVPSLQTTARFALEDGDIDRALESARKALRADPEADTSILRVALEARSGRLTGDDLVRAVTELRATSDRWTKITDPDYWEGMRHFRAGDFAVARPFLERAASRYPVDASVLGNLATAIKNGGDADTATTIYRGILERDPYNLPVRYNLARLYEARKDGFSAARELEAIDGMVPGFHLVRLEAAERAMKGGDRVRARAELESYVEENRGDPRKENLVLRAQQTLKGLDEP